KADQRLRLGFLPAVAGCAIADGAGASCMAGAFLIVFLWLNMPPRKPFFAFGTGSFFTAISTGSCTTGSGTTGAAAASCGGAASAGFCTSFGCLAKKDQKP